MYLGLSNDYLSTESISYHQVRDNMIFMGDKEEIGHGLV
jgi:hypothetical protein